MTYHLQPGKASFMVNATSGIVLYGPEQPRDTKVVVVTDSQSSEKWIGPTISGNKNNIHNGAAVVDAENPGKELQRVYQEQKQEETAMKKALSLSLMVAERERQEEEGLLHTAISLSAVANQEEIEEVEQLQQVMQQSELEFQLYNVDAEDSLLKAIELSRKARYEEDDELLNALEKSMIDF
jgi:hypothetical protein